MSKYDKYKKTALYEKIQSAITALEENQDIVVTTEPNIVVGYISQYVSPTASGLLSTQELESLAQAINELVNGVYIDDSEFQTRIGCSREELRNVLSKFTQNT